MVPIIISLWESKSPNNPSEVYTGAFFEENIASFGCGYFLMATSDCNC